MKKILLCADWHGKLPKASTGSDLMICAGDMEPNYSKNFDFFNPSFRNINKTAEAVDQKAWVEKTFIPWTVDNKVGKVIYLPGNHSFLDPTSLFEYSTFIEAKTIEVDGFKIGLLPGSMQLIGEWQLESTEYEMKERIAKLEPDIDILVSHVSPYGILDQAWSGDKIGCRELATAIFGTIGVEPYFTKLKINVFGHTHEKGGLSEEHEVDGRKIKFYNVAKNPTIIELES